MKTHSLPGGGEDRRSLSAGVLREALPYLQRYRKNLFVIKLGGRVVAEEAARVTLAEEVSLLVHVGIRVVVVHGGGPQASELAQRLGVEQTVIAGRRVTDRETLDIVKMVFAGQINIEILSSLRNKGVQAIGLSGVAADILHVKRRQAVVVEDPATGIAREVDYGYVGDIESVDPRPLRYLIEGEYVPVLSCLGGDAEGGIYNVNADTVASRIAVALGAQKLITLTDVDGLLIDGALVSEIDPDQARAHIAAGRIAGGMKVKTEAILWAIENGLPRAHILNGNRPDAILDEVFTRRGDGTLICRREG